MDTTRFDTLVRDLAGRRSRRDVARALSALALAGAGASRLDGAPALAKKRRKAKVTLCHNGQTIRVSKRAKKGHLNHGDSLGACPSPGSCAGGEGSKCGTQEIACLCVRIVDGADELVCMSAVNFDPATTCESSAVCDEGRKCALDPFNQTSAACLLPCSV